MASVDLHSTVQHLRKLAGAPVGADVADAQLLQRFVAHGDEAAFATLVQRHSALVYAVCRRVLQQNQDAEDALQATFLVLAGKARSIHKGQTLGSWLHGVAFRTASSLRKSVMRRRKHEEKAPERPAESPVMEASLRELQTLLDKEVDALPERFRAPFVLCCWEGRSRSEAARELGWKEGTVSSRLAQAREHLRQRLARHGVTLTAALSAAALFARPATATTPMLQVLSQAANTWRTHRTAENLPGHVVALAQGVLRTMSRATAKLVLTFCGATLLLGWGIGHFVQGTSFSGPQVVQAQQIDDPRMGETEPPQIPLSKGPDPNSGPGKGTQATERDIVGAGETAMELARTTKDPDAKWMAIRILGNLRYERAVPLLLDSLTNPNHLVRANAARALGDMRVARAERPLIQLLNKETNGGVIQQTVLALGHLHSVEALPALKVAANHDDVQTRMWVLQAIGGVGGKAEVPFLARFMLGDLSPAVQASAAQAIEQITGADFGFPKRSGPSSPEEGLQRARMWWEKHKAEYEHPEEEKGSEKTPTRTEIITRELQRMQGCWQVVEIERDGMTLDKDQIEKMAYARARAVTDDLGARRPPENVGGFVYAIDNMGKWTLRTGTGIVLDSGTDTIHRETKPRTLDRKMRAQQWPCIYDFKDDDTMLICAATPGKDRPTTFCTRSGDGNTVYTLKRIKDKE
jgi:RNA polymerase sigma factor (sigma-70 family)